MTRLGKAVFVAVNIVIFVFLLAPIVVVIGAAFNGTGSLAFPPQSISIMWFQKVMHNPAYMGALWMSIELGVLASIVALAVGSFTAYGVERLGTRWRGVMDVFFTSPLQIPTIITGVALLELYNGLGLPRSFATLLLGHIILCLPYVIRTIGAALYRFDRTIEEAAATLGAPLPRVLWSVTVPLLRPALVASGIFGFVVSFQNLAISMFLTKPGITTLPIQVFGYAQYSPDPGIAAISTIVVAVTVVIMLLVERFVGLESMF